MVYANAPRKWIFFFDNNPENEYIVDEMIDFKAEYFWILFALKVLSMYAEYHVCITSWSSDKKI